MSSKYFFVVLVAIALLHSTESVFLKKKLKSKFSPFSPLKLLTSLGGGLPFGGLPFPSKKFSLPSINLKPIVQPVSVHPIPVHSVPVHTVPVHTVPVHTVPVHTVPVHTVPVHTVPVHSVPVPSPVYEVPTAVIEKKEEPLLNSADILALWDAVRQKAVEVNPVTKWVKSFNTKEVVDVPNYKFVPSLGFTHYNKVNYFPIVESSVVTPVEVPSETYGVPPVITKTPYPATGPYPASS